MPQSCAISSFEGHSLETDAAVVSCRSSCVESRVSPYFSWGWVRGSMVLVGGIFAVLLGCGYVSLIFVAVPLSVTQQPQLRECSFAVAVIRHMNGPRPKNRLVFPLLTYYRPHLVGYKCHSIRCIESPCIFTPRGRACVILSAVRRGLFQNERARKSLGSHL